MANDGRLRRSASFTMDDIDGPGGPMTKCRRLIIRVPAVQHSAHCHGRNLYLNWTSVSRCLPRIRHRWKPYCHKRTGATLATRHFVGTCGCWMAQDEHEQHGNKKWQLQQNANLLENPICAWYRTEMKERSKSSSVGITSHVAFSCPRHAKGTYEDRIAQGALPLCWPFFPR
jgi:hypothetical protein